MTGALSIKINDSEVRKKLNDLSKGIKDRVMWANIREALRKGIVGNFKRGGVRSPSNKFEAAEKWEHVEKWVKKADGTNSYLTKTRTLRKIHSEHSDKGATVGTNTVYGKIHQFGSKKKKKDGKPIIPARPWLVVDAQTGDRIANIIEDYLEKITR